MLQVTPGGFIDANKCEDMVIKFPYFFDKEAVVIDPINADATGWCQLVYSTLQPLYRDDGVAVGTQDIQVYVWLEDVELLDPTPYVTSSKHKSETAVASGVLGSTMTAVKGVADALRSFPSLAPFATVASIMAGGAADTFSKLGWSRPTEPPDRSLMIKREVGSLIHYDGLDNSVRLALDSQNQVPISNGYLGKPSDELDYGSLFRRWGYLGNLSWTTAAAVDSTVGTLRITPWNAFYDAATVAYTPTPIMIPALVHENWTGTLKFRLLISGTPYHKGKLLLYYGPGTTQTAVSTAQAMTTGQCCVLDLTKEMDKVFEVGWAQQGAFLPLVATDTSVAQGGVAMPLATAFVASDSSCNGMLHIMVLDKLVANIDGANLTISVFVSGGDDLAFAGPSHTNLEGFKMASGVAAPFEAGMSVNVLPEVTCRFGGAPVDKLASLTRFGERFESLRPLLKPYRPWLSLIPYGDMTPLAGADVRLFTIGLPSSPVGFTGPPVAGTEPFTGSYNRCSVKPNLQGFLNACFTGYRGSVRSKFYVTTGPSVYPMDAFVSPVYQNTGVPQAITGTLYTSITNTAFTLVEANFAFLMGDVTTGEHFRLENRSNGFLGEIEVPQRARRLFMRNNTSTVATWTPAGVNFTVVGANMDIPPRIVQFSAIGEDFNYVNFVGCPNLIAASPWPGPGELSFTGP